MKFISLKKKQLLAHVNWFVHNVESAFIDTCSCLDSSIKFNMCKHIHLLAMFRINERKEPQLDFDSENVTHESLRIDLTKEHNIEDSSVVLSQLNKKTAIISLDLEKDKIMARISKHLSEIQSPTKLEVMKNMLQPLTPTLAAVESQRPHPISFENEPPNKKIKVQRRLFSTKKSRSKKASQKISRPKSEETDKIAAQLLLNFD